MKSTASSCETVLPAQQILLRNSTPALNYTSNESPFKTNTIMTSQAVIATVAPCRILEDSLRRCGNSQSDSITLENEKHTGRRKSRPRMQESNDVEMNSNPDEGEEEADHSAVDTSVDSGILCHSEQAERRGSVDRKSSLKLRSERLKTLSVEDSKAHTTEISGRSNSLCPSTDVGEMVHSDINSNTSTVNSEMSFNSESSMYREITACPNSTVSLKQQSKTTNADKQLGSVVQNSTCLTAVESGLTDTGDNTRCNSSSVALTSTTVVETSSRYGQNFLSRTQDPSVNHRHRNYATMNRHGPPIPRLLHKSARINGYVHRSDMLTNTSSSHSVKACYPMQYSTSNSVIPENLNKTLDKQSLVGFANLRNATGQHNNSGVKLNASFDENGPAGNVAGSTNSGLTRIDPNRVLCHTAPPDISNEKCGEKTYGMRNPSLPVIPKLKRTAMLNDTPIYGVDNWTPRTTGCLQGKGFQQQPSYILQNQKYETTDLVHTVKPMQYVHNGQNHMPSFEPSKSGVYSRCNGNQNTGPVSNMAMNTTPVSFAVMNPPVSNVGVNSVMPGSGVGLNSLVVAQNNVAEMSTYVGRQGLPLFLQHYSLSQPPPPTLQPMHPVNSPPGILYENSQSYNNHGHLAPQAYCLSQPPPQGIMGTTIGGDAGQTGPGPECYAMYGYDGDCYYYYVDPHNMAPTDMVPTTQSAQLPTQQPTNLSIHNQQQPTNLSIHNQQQPQQASHPPTQDTQVPIELDNGSAFVNSMSIATGLATIIATPSVATTAQIGGVAPVRMMCRIYIDPGYVPDPGLYSAPEQQSYMSLDPSTAGPATVTMVSPNHPLPMPMRVNLGHTVQQYVDENGTLTHVVMSLADPDAPPQLHHHHLHHGPMQGLPPGTQAPAITVQNGGLMFGHCYPQYPPFHGGPYPPHSQSHHGPHGPMGPHYHGPPPHQHIYSEGPHGGRTKERLRHKLHQQQHDKMAADESAGARYYHGPGETNSQRRPKKRVNGEVRRSGVAHDNGHSSSSGTEANDMDEEERRKINDMLSSLQQPKVSEVCARSTRITVTPVLDEVAETELNGTVSYQLYLQDKVREKAFRDVYTGVNTDVILRDLKPATEYIIKVRSQYRDHTEHLIGQESEQAAFKTLPCEPDTPPQPTMSKRTKTALTLKWNATCDNGAKLESYVLECDQAIGSTSEGSALSSPTSENCPPTATPTAGQFKPVYSGLDRQYKLTKLQPATQYTFRLAAVNTHGQSDFCTPVVFTTNGSAPSQPDPPQLAASDVTSLTVMWLRRQGDDTFLLQMDDEHTGHGFMPVYNGADVRYRVTNLRRNTEYKFRLEAVSEEGSSKPSEAVAFLTQPDRPQPPCRLQLKGKAHSNTFKLSWDPPRDNGGMEVSLYRLELDAGRGFERRYEGPDFECLCDQLIPGQSYRARVCAYNGTKYSEFSEEVIVETLPVVPGPCVAPKLQGKARATMLHLRWVPPVYDGGARPTAYEVLMSQSDSTTRLVYSGAGMDCAVASLLPGRPYLFQVRAGNCVGPGPWSECLEVLSGAGVPDAPRAPSVTCRGSHSALVAWEEPLNNGAAVSDYRLEWQGGNLTDFTQLYQGPALSYEARGLEPASCYSFRVQAVNSAGAGAYSTPAQIQTSAAPPGPVPGLRASATAESIHVTWKEAQSHGSEVLNYNIDIGESHVIQAPGGALEYSIGKLVPETQYRVRIQAVNSLGAGPFSASRSVTTLALPPSPPVVECVSAAPNSLKLRWGDGRNPEQLHYCLEIRRNNSFIPYYQGPLQLKKVDRLQETTDYVFRINASNKAGDGPCSEHFTFRTSKAPPPAVKEPQVSEVTRDSCMVTWSAVKGQGHDKVEYTLQLQLCRGSNNVYKEVYRGESTSHRLHNLLDHTDYLVRVCAHRVSLPTPRPSPRPAVTRIAKIEANTPACEVTAKGDSEELNVARPPQYVGDAEEVGHSVEEGRAEEVEHGKEGVKASNGSVVTNSNNYATNTAASDVSDAQGNVGSENHVFSPSAILIPIAVAKALIESEDNAKALNIEAAPVILTGAFSPGRKFTTKRNEVATHSGGTSSAVATRSGGLTGWFRRSHKLAFAKTGNASGEHTKLTDKQWAAIFLIVFTFLSIFLAYMAQHLIGANHSSAPSSTGGAHGQGHSGVTGNPAP